MCQVDGVLDDVHLVLERGLDVDGRIGDHERVRIGGDVGKEHVAEAACGTQTVVLGDHCAHQLVGVQRAFHQGLDLKTAGHRHCKLRRLHAVDRIHDADAGKVQALFLGNRADALFRADQDRLDEARLACLERAAQGFRIAGVGDRDLNRREAVGNRQQVAIAQLAVGEVGFGKIDARALDLFGGRLDLGGAVDHLEAVLVDAQAVEQQVMVVLELLAAGDGDGEGVADAYGAPEIQPLRHIPCRGRGIRCPGSRRSGCCPTCCGRPPRETGRSGRTRDRRGSD